MEWRNAIAEMLSGNKGRREARANWGPRLPTTEAYPEGPKPLRAVSRLLLVLAAAVVLILLLAQAVR